MVPAVSSRGTTFLKRGLVAGALAASLAVPGFVASGTSLATPSRSDLASAQARLEQLRNDFEIAVEKYNTVKSRLEDIRREMTTTELQVEDLRRNIDKHEKIAVRVARRLYEGGPSGALEMVLSAKSLGQIESTLQYLKSTESDQAKVFERLAVDRRQLSLKLAALDKARRQVSEDESRLAELKSSIQDKMASQQHEIDRLQAAIRRARQRERARLAAQRRAAAESQPAAAQVAAPAPPPAPSVAAVAPNAQTAVDTALAQVGKPYQWGAAGPESFDCSGLTMYSWAAAGVSLPHSSSAQYSVTRHVSLSSVQPGDLLFYYSPVHHVAMYIGGGRMVEAPYTGASVRVASLRTSNLVGVGRP